MNVARSGSPSTNGSSSIRLINVGGLREFKCLFVRKRIGLEKGSRTLLNIHLFFTLSDWCQNCPPRDFDEKLLTLCGNKLVFYKLIACLDRIKWSFSKIFI